MVEQLPAALDRVFRALADPTRRAMLLRLARGPRSVGALAAPLKMSLAAVSKHVKTLERAGLIGREVRGRVHLCHLAPEPLHQAELWLRHFERFWSELAQARAGLPRPRDLFESGSDDDSEEMP